MRIKSWILAGIIWSVSSILTGCSTTELEERCFPMMVSVGYEDGQVLYGVAFPKEEKGEQAIVRSAGGTSFSESKRSYEKRLNKDADYNHLKVLVLEEDFLEKNVVYDGMLEELAQTEDFPRNTYVCVIEDLDDLEELEKNISQDLGTYLEEYLKKQEEQKKSLFTLGDLIDEKENQAMDLRLPYLEVEENFVEWNGYMNTTGKSWKESEIE